MGDVRLRLLVWRSGWLAIVVVLMMVEMVEEVVVVGVPLELKMGRVGEGERASLNGPHRAATGGLMGSVVGALGPIVRRVPRLYARHDGWHSGGLGGRLPGDKFVAAGLRW